MIELLKSRSPSSLNAKPYLEGKCLLYHLSQPSESYLSSLGSFLGLQNLLWRGIDPTKTLTWVLLLRVIDIHDSRHSLGGIPRFLACHELVVIFRGSEAETIQIESGEPDVVYQSSQQDWQCVEGVKTDFLVSWRLELEVCVDDLLPLLVMHFTVLAASKLELTINRTNL